MSELKTKRRTFLDGIHLFVASLIVMLAALSYGLVPSNILPRFLDITNFSTDLLNLLRAVMGIYLAFASFWLLGALKQSLWRPASISLVLFMSGLVFGRIISMIMDGIPSAIFVLGGFGEAFLALYTVILLKRKS